MRLCRGTSSLFCRAGAPNMQCADRREPRGIRRVFEPRGLRRVSALDGETRTTWAVGVVDLRLWWLGLPCPLV